MWQVSYGRRLFGRSASEDGLNGIFVFSEKTVVRGRRDPIFQFIRVIAGPAEALAKGSVGKNRRGNRATHRLASARRARGFVAADGWIGAEFVGHGRTIARIFSDHWEAPKTIRKHTKRNE